MANAPITWGLRVLITKALEYWVEHGGLSFFDSYHEDALFQGRKVSFIFDRPAESYLSTRDTEMFSFALFKISASQPDASWSTSDYTNAETLMTAWWTGLRSNFHTDLRFETIRWYNEGPGVSPPQPAIRITPVGSPGTGTNAALPPQISTTVTLKTAQRTHWGRIYLPAPHLGCLEATEGVQGRWLHSFVDAIENSTASMLNQLGQMGLVPAVWSRSGEGFMSVTGFEVDDVPDIQRRRRFATTGYRKQSAAG